MVQRSTIAKFAELYLHAFHLVASSSFSELVDLIIDGLQMLCKTQKRL